MRHEMKTPDAKGCPLASGAPKNPKVSGRESWAVVRNSGLGSTPFLIHLRPALQFTVARKHCARADPEEAATCLRPVDPSPFRGEAEGLWRRHEGASLSGETASSAVSATPGEPG